MIIMLSVSNLCTTYYAQVIKHNSTAIITVVCAVIL